MKPEHRGTRVLRAEAVAHDGGVDTARGAKLGDLFQKVIMRVEEEESRGAKESTIEPRSDRGFDIGDGVGESERELLHGGRAGFANVIAADGDGVPLRQLAAGPGEQIGDDAHRRARRINVGPARDVLLQDVVLNGAREFAQVGALLLAPPVHKASRMAAVELIVIDVVTSSSGMPSKESLHVGAANEIATPTRPTSPAARG